MGTLKSSVAAAQLSIRAESQQGVFNDVNEVGTSKAKKPKKRLSAVMNSFDPRDKDRLKTKRMRKLY